MWWRPAPWRMVAGLAAAAAATAIVVSGVVDGFRCDNLAIVALGGLVIAVLERHPVAVSPGHSGRRYLDVTELGLGLLLVATSPAALGLVVAVAYVPLLFRPDVVLWKRVFGAAQPALAAVVAGWAYTFMEARSSTWLWAVLIGGSAFTAVQTAGFLAMAGALGERAMVRETLRSLPSATAVVIAGTAAGFVLADALIRDDTAVLGLIAVLGLVALVWAGHEASMRADRMRVLFTATAQLTGRAERPGLAALLKQLGPVVVPGAERLSIESARPVGREAVPVGDRGWLVVERTAAADRPTREDAERLELLAGVIDEALHRSEEIEAASEAAATDPLTGLLNRRGLEGAVDSLDEPCAVVMVDLDGLKVINDRYGHAAGDAAIAALSRALRQGVRSEDLVARVGGDEFVVVIVGRDAAAARPIVERLAANAADDPDLPDGVQVRASLGAAAWSPGGGTTWAEATAQADAELYASRAARGVPSRRGR